MLHIVNGDVVAEKLRQSGVQGDVLVWREIYSEGPIFNDLSETSNRVARALYLEKSLGIPNQEFLNACAVQEKELAEFRKYEEVVLWFEHDLFDQTMLCYLLSWFAKQSLGKTKLSLLCIGAYPGIELFRGLGQLSVEQLESLSGTWQSVGEQELELGSLVWKAYSSPDPTELVQVLSGDTTALPFVHKAFQLHLSRFPSLHNGLGIVEQVTLEMVRDGQTSSIELFQQVGDKLHELGMGDLQFWRTLEAMSQSKHPLLQIDGETEFPSYQNAIAAWKQSTIKLTEFGRRVIEGHEDWVESNGIDEWYGGVHLEGNFIPWRWDSLKRELDMM
jgi:Domain of unknown function (DUF1835)